MRWLFAVATLTGLTGCDIVFGLDEMPQRPVFFEESETHDEDNDEIADRDDLCPHLDNGETDDFDSDGIGDACDPRPEQFDVRHFISFEGGDTGRLVRSGVIAAEGDAILFGDSLEQHSALTLPIQATIADIEVDVTIVKTKVLVPGEYAEVGLFSVHRAFDASHKSRGDVCFFGTDLSDVAAPNFLEFNNDDSYLAELGTRFAGDIIELHGTFKHARNANELSCNVDAPGRSYSGSGPHKDVPRTISGAVALTTHLMQVRLEYLWVVTPRP